MEFHFVKIVVFVPEESGNRIRECLTETGCGRIGNYDSCSFSSRGIGRFRPLAGATPAIGSIETLEQVVEERIEVICPFENYEDVLVKIREVHPYEEPAIEVYPLLHP